MRNTGYLNGLRALAAFTVLACHCMIWSDIWPSLPMLPILPVPGQAAKLAVDLFMVLSGYLMALHAHSRSMIEPFSNPSAWLKFYFRRICRIAPAYYLCLAVAAVLSVSFLEGYGQLAERIPYLKNSIYNASQIEYTASNILLHMTFVFGLLPDWVSTTQLPDWSLSLEMQFYLVFPLLSLASIRFGALRVGAVIVPICLLATKLWAKHFPEPSLLLFKLPVFYVGILLFYSVVAADKNKRTCLTFGAVILTFTQVQFYGYRACWLAVLTFPIVLIGQELGQGRWAAFQFWLGRILDNRVTELSSEWSYSVYLFHGFFISILGSALFRSSTFLECSKLAKLGIFFTVVLLGTVLVSMFVYYLVERPFIELGKLLISRFEQRRARISAWSPNE